MKPNDFIEYFQSSHPASYSLTDLSYTPFEEWGTKGHCFASASLWLEQFHAKPFHKIYQGEMLCSPDQSDTQKKLIETYQNNASFYGWNHPLYYQDLNEQLHDFYMQVEPSLCCEASSLKAALTKAQEGLSGLVFLQDESGVTSKTNPGHVIAFAFRHHPETNRSVFGLFDSNLGQIILRLDLDKKIPVRYLEIVPVHDTYIPVIEMEKIDPLFHIEILINKMSELTRQHWQKYKTVILNPQPRPSGKCILHRYQLKQERSECDKINSALTRTLNL